MAGVLRSLGFMAKGRRKMLLRLMTSVLLLVSVKARMFIGTSELGHQRTSGELIDLDVVFLRKSAFIS